MLPLAVTTDVVIFTIRRKALQLLLIKRKKPPFQDVWALPGGFAGAREGLETSAMRQLEEETGLRDLYLEQLYTFGDPQRDSRQRVICVAYYALVPSERLHLNTNDSDGPTWFAFDQLPPLAFDHAEVCALAHRRLTAKLAYSTIALQFMPSQFTLGELQSVYEIISSRPLDKRNFRKHALALAKIEPTGAERRNGKHRPARLYRVKRPGQVDIIK
jgi:8-oxo-dGTP diphosphatase